MPDSDSESNEERNGPAAADLGVESPVGVPALDANSRTTNLTTEIDIQMPSSDIGSDGGTTIPHTSHSNPRMLVDIRLPSSDSGTSHGTKDPMEVDIENPSIETPHEIGALT